MENVVKYKCIVVEDEALIRRSISKKIQDLNLGFEVAGEVMDGRSALKLIEEELPHLVITDIQMPIMDGLELIKNIYFSYPNTKVIVISGYNNFEYARQAIQYEVKDYLLKPVNTEELASILNKLKLQLDSSLMFLFNLASLKSQNESPEKLVKLVEMYLKENYKRDLTIEEVAKNLHFSPDYLSRVYKKCTGQSPLKYVINLRINEAKQILLSDLNVDIKTVGESVGYPDPHYFSRIFKNHTGLYPSEYRSLKQRK